MHGHINGEDDLHQQVANLEIEDGHRDLTTDAFASWNSEPPPAPKLSSKGIIAMDITEQFANAAQQLEVGQLVKDPHFTLFEAVGALEIMDPKMDSGYLEPGETMDDEYDFSQPLLPEEILGIIDHMLCDEMAWHMGYPLAQTIFTSLHIDRLLDPCPTSLEQTYFDRSESCSDEPITLQILRAYCLGLIKTCSYVNNRVKSEHFHEEEDFVTHTFNRSLLENIDHDAILDLISETTKLLYGVSSIRPELVDALDCRLTFRAAFLKTVHLAESRDSPKDLKAHWIALQALLPGIKTSSKLGNPVPSSFSHKLQRKLASTTPPRPIVHIGEAAAYDELERLCQDGAVAAEVLDYHDSHSLMTFVFLFQQRKPQPATYIRTLLQHYIFGDMTILGTMSIRQLLDGDLASTVIPTHKLLDRANDEVELPTDPRHKMASQMELFRTRAAGSYLDILRTLCQNRCRIRRTLCRSVADWEVLQLDAEELDADLRQYTGEEPVLDRELGSSPSYSFPLSSWAYFYKLRQMEWLIQMGFELEVYQTDEHASMYWYLQYIARTRSRHLERMRGFIVRAFKGHERAKVSREEHEEYMNALAFNNYHSLESTATFGLADALSCLFTVLARLSLVVPPPRPYSNDQKRYEVRMKPFQLIGLPELIPFDDLTRVVTQPEESTSDLLKFAADSVQGAKRGFEILSKLDERSAFCQGSKDSWLKNMKNCLKACIFTGISIAAVKKAFEQKAKDQRINIKIEIPATGKGYHDWWVVPKVIPVP
ncbi:amino-acid N-acetyltransferase-like protein subunit Mak10 [Tricladium varicosporioides]|nr:amino-acid N-acetyltransferase-like protein subunit Mak10 [Hymenoscyphus varicosporioides]